MTGTRMLIAVVASITLIAAAGCSSESSTSPTTAGGENSEITETSVADDTTAVPTTEPAPTTDPPPVTEDTDAPTTTKVIEPPDTTAAGTPADEADIFLHGIVEVLASDELAGRDNGTEGSEQAQSFLIALMAQFADPVAGDPSDAASYMQPFAGGTNLIGLIPGTDLADQFVIVGAHYDHLGSDCLGIGADDAVCNGASDNATGVAAAMAVGRDIADSGGSRRSVILALWDAEEDGLLGSAAYLANPLVPLDRTVGYVNFDIQGTSMSPRLADVTVAVGAETGGANLIDATRTATEASTLDTVMLSLLFGQGRSDHANFVSAGVPSVFFTDATPPCYHTAGDDVSIVDFPKLAQQVATAQALTRTLTDAEAVPVFDPDAPPASFADAVAIHDLLVRAQPDFARFPETEHAVADQFVIDLATIVAAGEAAFDDAAISTLLTGTVQIVTLWSNGVCEGFLDPQP